MQKMCSISGCDGFYYAKTYCINHYEKFHRTGNPLGLFLKKCEWEGCFKKTKEIKKFCGKHSIQGKFREKYNFPFNNTFDWRVRMRGENNPRWNNGKSPYKNHSIMKKNRIIKLLEQKGKCEICNKNGQHIHHKDGTKENHSLDNLILICCKCHKKLHPSKNSKYYFLYGYTSTELTEILNCSTGKIAYLHKNNLLQKFIDSIC